MTNPYDGAIAESLVKEKERLMGLTRGQLIRELIPILTKGEQISLMEEAIYDSQARCYTLAEMRERILG